MDGITTLNRQRCDVRVRTTNLVVAMPREKPGLVELVDDSTYACRRHLAATTAKVPTPDTVKHHRPIVPNLDVAGATTLDAARREDLDRRRRALSGFVRSAAWSAVEPSEVDGRRPEHVTWLKHGRLSLRQRAQTCRFALASDEQHRRGGQRNASVREHEVSHSLWTTQLVVPLRIARARAVASDRTAPWERRDTQGCRRSCPPFSSRGQLPERQVSAWSHNPNRKPCVRRHRGAP